jgi:peptidoglycan hydrolase-like protein with peptidoglycan-binding domain
MAIRHTLSVTSPLTRGPEVLEAQNVLNGGNVFARDFLQGAVDGVFGQETGRACIRAKYWLGYPTAGLDPTYGEKLDGYLHGLERPTAAMLKRTVLRGAEAKQVPMRKLALDEAVKQLGTKESPPGSNIVRYSKWYGIRGPWCAMFVTWCYHAAHSKTFIRGQRYAYVPYIVHDARAGLQGLSVTKTPMPGDVVCYDWNRDGLADHTGLFERGTAQAFHAIEGNTALGNDSNGGEVMRRSRSSSDVLCFVRVGR